MKKSKKGITLVELVICCAVLALLAGAVTAVLMSGEHLFSTSADSASAQMELDVLQTNLVGIMPSAKNISVSSMNHDGFAFPLTGHSIYFNDSKLIIRSSVAVNEDGVTSVSTKETELSGVVSFSYKITPAGVIPQDASATATARPLFSYTVTFSDGTVYRGGFVINNFPYVDIGSLAGSIGEKDVLSFSVPTKNPQNQETGS
jgi:hypothetical protein